MSPHFLFLVDFVNAQYAALNQEALLHISGPDSLAFLQGQTTCDTRIVNLGQATVGAYCTPKGRVVCDFLLSQLAPDQFALRLRADILEVSAATFGKYIIFSKAELAKDNKDWQLYACWGDDASHTLGSALGIAGGLDTQASKYASVAGEGFVVIQMDDKATAFECYIDGRTHPELIPQLASLMSRVNESCWQAIQIDQGTARIEAATVEAFIPQVLNYDLTGHISFDKGCYTGQEVVARLHYRGKPKKRLYKASATVDTAPDAGAALFSAGKAQSAGTLVNAAIGASNTVTALIVAPISQEKASLHMIDSNGPLITYKV